VLVVGADADRVRAALAGAGEDEDVIVLDPAAAALEAARRSFRDPRVWLAIGDPDVIPLPDQSVDEVVGEVPPAELARIRR
jgi:ubiquinone/menaquinone biosynthesis C-methylase UbiE